MLNKTIKDIIGKEFYFIDANMLEVKKGLCAGVSLTKATDDKKRYLLVYLETKTEHKSVDYRHVCQSKEQAEKWLASVSPHVKECNSIVATAQDSVNKIREEHITGKPYLTLTK